MLIYPLKYSVLYIVQNDRTKLKLEVQLVRKTLKIVFLKKIIFPTNGDALTSFFRVKN